MPENVAEPRHVPRGPLQAGERVMLIHERRDKTHMVTLIPGKDHHSHLGHFSFDEVIGSDDGTRVRTSKGSTYLVLRPRMMDHVLNMPRGAQVIYPKDIGPILLMADIFPGARVLESGVGSGALTTALLRAVGPTGHIVGYELREDFANRARKNIAVFAPLDNLEIKLRDVYEGIDETDLDRIVLDLPEPWRLVPHAEKALASGGTFLAYLPTIIQVDELRKTLALSRFVQAETIEVFHRGWNISGRSVRPEHRMVGHTGFLTAARLQAPYHGPTDDEGSQTAALEDGDIGLDALPTGVDEAGEDSDHPRVDLPEDETPHNPNS
ncbi:MAG: tRNA (adenine-N1)-methyltransferase [Acidimicrobiia bacterium]|nr:tRNA (adenine-N1)-methyltransferase [Acidimicrobiia bacterium]MBP8182441.1 tRNA (adenine-N1)-methyltransferase [Acidimicrobiia bacterium]